MVRETREQQTAVLQLLTAVCAGLLGVIFSLWAYSSLVGPQATHAGAVRRMSDFIYWTQPFVYLGAGMLAGHGDRRGGPMRAPVIGLFLAAFGYLVVRRLDLLPPGSTIPSYMITAGALFALVGAVLATLIGERTNVVIGLLVLAGVVAYIVAYFNLGSVSGRAQHEVIQRAAGMTVQMKTETVPDLPLSLIDPDTRTELYRTRTNSGGRFRFNRVPPGDYILHTVYGYGRERTVVEMKVKAERTIMGGSQLQVITLPTEVREAGNIFE
ncbi:MAG: hypothetical protein J7M38_11895 [Armatimonadetes bacterium]|nr:hypothetical protein [Armatimonadota bacterium]